MDVYACTSDLNQDQDHCGLILSPKNEIMGIKNLIALAVVLWFEHDQNHLEGPSAIHVSRISGAFTIQWQLGVKDKVLTLVEWLVTKRKNEGSGGAEPRKPARGKFHSQSWKPDT